MSPLNDLQAVLEGLYLLLAGILVLWMVAGLALFEAGLVRARNTTDILVKNFAIFSLGSLVFLLFSYHMMFTSVPGSGKFIPDTHFIAALDAFPHVLGNGQGLYLIGAFFQVILAVITVSIISGATAERLKLWPFLFFATLMVGFIYPIQGYWIWGQGFLKQLGFIDIAGAGVVHLTGALAALPCVLMMGARQGRYDGQGRSLPMPGANMPIAAAGLFMIWIGCFGFNSGSLFNYVGIANNIGNVFLNTLVAGSTGLLVTMILLQIFFGAVDLTVLFNGALIGLVSISASPVTPNFAEVMMTATVASCLMMIFFHISDKCKIDDPVGAIAVHGIGGVVGLIAATFSQNYDALSQLHGQTWLWHQQLGVQCLGIVTIIIWVSLTSLVAWLCIRLLLGLRMSPADEYKGLDVLGCGMVAYPEFTDSGWEK